VPGRLPGKEAPAPAEMIAGNEKNFTN